MKLLDLAATSFSLPQGDAAVEVDCNLIDYIEAGFTGDRRKVIGPYGYVIINPTRDVPRGEMRLSVKKCKACGK